MSFWTFLLASTFTNTNSGGTSDGSGLGASGQGMTGTNNGALNASLQTDLQNFATDFLNKTLFAVLKSGDFTCWNGTYTDADAQAGFEPVVQFILMETGIEQAFNSGDVEVILKAMSDFDNMLRRGIYEAQELSSSEGSYYAGWRSGCSKQSFKTMLSLLTQYRSETMPKMLDQLTSLGIKYRTTTQKAVPKTSVITLAYDETGDIFQDYQKTGVVGSKWRWRKEPNYNEVTYTLVSVPKELQKEGETAQMQTSSVSMWLSLGLLGALGYGFYESVK